MYVSSSIIWPMLLLRNQYLALFNYSFVFHRSICLLLVVNCFSMVDLVHPSLFLFIYLCLFMVGDFHVIMLLFYRYDCYLFFLSASANMFCSFLCFNEIVLFILMVFISCITLVGFDSLGGFNALSREIQGIHRSRSRLSFRRRMGYASSRWGPRDVGGFRKNCPSSLRDVSEWKFLTAQYKWITQLQPNKHIANTCKSNANVLCKKHTQTARP